MSKVEIKMKYGNRFFIATMSIIMGFVLVTPNNTIAASRVAVRGTPATAGRKSIAAVKTTTTQPVATTVETVAEPDPTPVIETTEIAIENKSSEFESAVSSVMESASTDNSFAEAIRKQKAAFAVNDASKAVSTAQKNAIAGNSNTCDRDLRKCMQQKCGDDFTKCALDGDTIFGDKLNACRRDTTCTATEFNLFVPEIRADRDMNVRLASYEKVINCGNQYNACIVNECGTTYNKCLGKANADAAIQKCATIAKECTESDSGLASRFGTAIGKLRENAEKEVKADEERMYAMRDSMSNVCKKLGAMFDERTFDCVYTVNFFAGEKQDTPMASRKRYAGDSFVCMQEWFGVNVTTYKENAYRETRAQTAASSAMLGSGVGTAVGLASSGAIGRALDTQKAKKELDKEKEAQGETEESSDEKSQEGGYSDVPPPAANDGGENATPKPAQKKIEADTRLQMQKDADKRKQEQTDKLFGSPGKGLADSMDKFNNQNKINSDLNKIKTDVRNNANKTDTTSGFGATLKAPTIGNNKVDVTKLKITNN